METNDTMNNAKKTYSTPELTEHGDLVQMTQGGATGRPEGTFGGTNPAGIIFP